MEEVASHSNSTDQDGTTVQLLGKLKIDTLGNLYNSVVTEKIGISFGCGVFLLVTNISYGMFHLYKNSNAEYDKRLLNVLYSHIAMVWQCDTLLSIFNIMSREVLNIR